MSISTEYVLNKYRILENDFAELIPKFHFSKDINMKLERIVHLMSILGDPHNSFKSIHVGGTSGKGSTSTLIASILTAHGYKTGLHLSPHLQIINERYQINGKMVATTKLAKILERVKPAIEEVAKNSLFGHPSYFEVQVALAFCLFEEERVDVAVIEVGLGGRLDATNILSSQVSVLTSVGLDHMEILGNTVEEIAEEKAGIIKNNQKVVSGFSQRSTKKIVQNHCEANNSFLWQMGDDFTFTVNDSLLTVNLPGKTYAELQLKVLGDFQLSNATCAVAAVHLFLDGGVFDAAVREGLTTASIPGRMEILQTKPFVVLDGAHNPDKMISATSAINSLFKDNKRVVVLALKKGKTAEEILPYLIVNTKLIVLTTFNTKGLWEPYLPEQLEKIIKTIDPNMVCFTIHDPIDAIKYALSKASDDDLVWITGSLYLAGDVREYWYPSEELLITAEGMISYSGSDSDEMNLDL
jgi:dihydrofolate synthase / folylpolyglutamate synthase